MVIKGYRIRVAKETDTILDGYLGLTVGLTQPMRSLLHNLLEVLNVGPPIKHPSEDSRSTRFSIDDPLRCSWHYQDSNSEQVFFRKSELA